MSKHYFTPEEIRDLRAKVLAFFGGKCMNPNCLVSGGCIDKRCLQIDHIQAVGKNRLIAGELYLDILESSNSRERYQLLCANCNWIKRSEKKETRGNVTVEGQQRPLNPIVPHIDLEEEYEPRYVSQTDLEKALKKLK